MKISHSHRTHSAARPESGLPRPAHALVPYAAILAWTASLCLAHVIGSRWALALAAAAVVGGALAAWWTVLARAHMCDRVDRFIATGAGEPPSAAAVAERRAELVTVSERRTLATTLRRAVATAFDPPVRTARAPIASPAVRAERDRLEQLAARLADTDVPVSARGVARTYMLVTDAASPLYHRTPEGPELLHRHLVQTLYELEVNERR